MKSLTDKQQEQIAERIKEGITGGYCFDEKDDSDNDFIKWELKIT